MPALKGTRTEPNLKDAFAGESQANRRYLYFAQKADVEGYNDISAVFRSTAEGETHEYTGMYPGTRATRPVPTKEVGIDDPWYGPGGNPRPGSRGSEKMTARLKAGQVSLASRRSDVILTIVQLFRC